MPAASHRSRPELPFDAVRDLARESPVAVTVRGGSMAPLLADGDQVEIAPARIYWPGDVLAFRSGDGLIIHRLLGYRRYNKRLAAVTRGDAAPRPDSPVALDRLLGRVVRVGGRTARQAGLVSSAARARAAVSYLGLMVAFCGLSARRRLRRFFPG
jgi:signal peptidase I